MVNRMLPVDTSHTSHASIPHSHARVPTHRAHDRCDALGRRDALAFALVPL